MVESEGWKEGLTGGDLFGTPSEPGRGNRRPHKPPCDPAGGIQSEDHEVQLELLPGMNRCLNGFYFIIHPFIYFLPLVEVCRSNISVGQTLHRFLFARFDRQHLNRLYGSP